MFFSFLTSIFSTGENCTDLNILDKEYLYSISRQDNLSYNHLVGGNTPQNIEKEVQKYLGSGSSIPKTVERKGASVT